jgi:hypothetical protein
MRDILRAALEGLKIEVREMGRADLVIQVEHTRKVLDRICREVDEARQHERGPVRDPSATMKGN